MKPTLIFCDFDGTLFDPDLRMLAAPLYNRRSSALMNGTDTTFVVTTGRHSWGPWTQLNYKLTGMRQPDMVVAGAGTIVLTRKGSEFILDTGWEEKMNREFDKPSIQKKLAPILEKNLLKDFTVPNNHMIVITVYQKTLDEVAAIREELALHLKEDNVKVTLSEQLFFKNTKELFNGYALIVPESAGKDGSLRYVLDKYEKSRSEAPDVLAFGDASIDIPMLTMNKPKNAASFQGYGVHLTPLAETALEGLDENMPKVFAGLAPRSIFKVLSEYYTPPRNSPYRRLISPFEALIDKTVHPGMTPDELTAKGLADVRAGLKEGGIGGFIKVAKGHIFDAADGIRARRHPELKSKDGQLIDVYADRVKEFESLMMRGRPEAALTCILPSIARAQAEALGARVPEHDPEGGSALSRTKRLLASLFFYNLGFTFQSKAIDERIAAANLATFRVRRRASESFSWKPADLKTYDKPSLERLLLLIERLQEEHKQVPDVKIEEADEYLNIKTATIRASLKIPQPTFVEEL